VVISLLSQNGLPLGRQLYSGGSFEGVVIGFNSFYGDQRRRQVTWQVFRVDGGYARAGGKPQAAIGCPRGVGNGAYCRGTPRNPSHALHPVRG